MSFQLQISSPYCAFINVPHDRNTLFFRKEQESFKGCLFSQQKLKYCGFSSESCISYFKVGDLLQPHIVFYFLHSCVARLPNQEHIGACEGVLPEYCQFFFCEMVTSQSSWRFPNMTLGPKQFGTPALRCNISYVSFQKFEEWVGVQLNSFSMCVFQKKSNLEPTEVQPFVTVQKFMSESSLFINALEVRMCSVLVHSSPLRKETRAFDFPCVSCRN